MSKRIPNGACRVYGLNTRKLSVIAGPMTKGQALIRARSILGPDGFVSQILGEFPMVFVRAAEGRAYTAGVGDTWEEALASAAKSPQAIEWSDKQVEQGNEIELAKDNLKKAQEESTKTRVKRFFGELAERFQRQKESKETQAENYELWKEGRQEDLEAAAQRTKLLAALAPEDRLALLTVEKQAAKLLRRNDYDQLTARR